MHLADRSDSATGVHASPDNVTRNITRIDLKQDQVARMLTMTNRSHENLSAIRTLLLAATEAAETLECEEDRAITPVYVRSRMEHLTALLGLLYDHLDRIDGGVTGTHHLLRDNMQRVAA